MSLAEMIQLTVHSQRPVSLSEYITEIVEAICLPDSLCPLQSSSDLTGSAKAAFEIQGALQEKNTAILRHATICRWLGHGIGRNLW